jgi:hypothetical protein
MALDDVSPCPAGQDEAVLAKRSRMVFRRLKAGLRQ